jgi:hypothetical protein
MPGWLRMGHGQSPKGAVTSGKREPPCKRSSYGWALRFPLVFGRFAFTSAPIDLYIALCTMRRLDNRVEHCHGATFWHGPNRGGSMHMNQFSLRIPEGQETHSGYVEMRHGKQYSIQLRNDRDVPCDAKVSVDGKEIGVWRIYAKSGILLERPAEDTGRFTFYELGTDEAVKAKLHSVKPNDLGLVQVLFTPMRNWTMTVSYPPNYYHPSDPYYYKPWPSDDNGTAATTNSFPVTLTAMNCSPGGTKPQASSGGTGLSGHSQQAFSPVGEIALDHSQATTITLRLIIRQSSDARELRPIQNANPVPPPLDDWDNYAMCPSCWSIPDTKITDTQRSRGFIRRGRKPYGG